MKWINVKDQVPDDGVPVLILQNGNDVCDRLILQAQRFEGCWYPDHLGGFANYGDRLTVEFWSFIDESE